MLTKLKTNRDVYTAFAEGRVEEAYNKRTGVRLQGNFLYGPDNLLAIRLGRGRLFLVNSQRLSPRFTREAFDAFLYLRHLGLPTLCLNFDFLRSYGFDIEAFEPLEFYEFPLSSNHNFKDSVAVVRHRDQILVLAHQYSGETCAAYLVSDPEVAYDVARTATYAPSRDALFCGGVWLIPLPEFANDIFSSDVPPGVERYKHFRIPRTASKPVSQLLLMVPSSSAAG